MLRLDGEQTVFEGSLSFDGETAWIEAASPGFAFELELAAEDGFVEVGFGIEGVSDPVSGEYVVLVAAATTCSTTPRTGPS